MITKGRLRGMWHRIGIITTLSTCAGKLRGRQTFGFLDNNSCPVVVGSDSKLEIGLKGGSYFYELLGLRDVRYRVMAKQYRWHRFGPEWELLPKNKMASLDFCGVCVYVGASV